jgi:undecaprenyl diphosphate synthase
MTPRALALVLDGNGRWARARGRSELIGHTQGYLIAREIVRAAFDRGISHVVLWAGSRSNFQKRDPVEMRHLAKILKFELRRQRGTSEEGRIRICGDRSLWGDPALERVATEAEEATKRYSARNLWILFGYDAETDDEQAALAAYAKGLPPTRENVRKHLWTAELPGIDFFIRTGCENLPNESDGFLWRHRQDAVLLYTPILWPDFTVSFLDDALDSYHRQPRRRGGREHVQIAAE